LEKNMFFWEQGHRKENSEQKREEKENGWGRRAAGRRSLLQIL